MTKPVGMYYIINREVLYFPQESKLAYIGEGDQKVNLNLPASRCLKFLLENRNRVISRDDFLETVWRSNGSCVAENTFYQNISILRKSLKLVGLTDDIIVTIRRKGFSLADDVIVECIDGDVSESENMNVAQVHVLSKQEESNSKKNKCMGLDANVAGYKYWFLLTALFLLLIIESISLGISFFS